MDIYTIIIILIGAAMVLYYQAKLKNSGERLDPQAFKEKLEQEAGTVIDVRTKGEHKAASLKITDQNIDIMQSDFNKQIEQLDKDRNYFLYCRSGSRSGKAQRIMKNMGFDRVYNIGGLQQLLNAGFDKKNK
jgi:phage shock protein E